MTLKFSKHKLYSIIFLVSLIVVFFYQRFYYQELTIKIVNSEYKVLVAKTIYQQKKGLGKRDNLKNFDGMVFPYFVLSRHGMVMRDMNFAIDIIWLKDGVVIDMAPNVEPELGVKESDLKIYYPRISANVVLELKAGEIQKNGFKIGDKLEIVE